MSVWLEFLLCLAVIGIAGVKLSRYGDAIADKTGLGGTWVGVVLLATVTSLPELATGLSSVTYVHAPEIAVGDALGSCVFNLAILVVLDFFHRSQPMYQRAAQGHILSAGFGVIVLALTGFSILAAANGISPRIGHVGAYTPVILMLYAGAIRTVYRYEAREVRELSDAQPDAYPAMTLRQASVRYALAALAVIAAGVWLPVVGVELAERMGWTHSFVGTLFVAFVTSVPELVVSIAAVHLGALDMAIGNLLGSNLFNIMIIALDDIAYLPGAILADVSIAHAATALSACMMTGIAVVGLMYRPASRLLGMVGWASVLLAGVYLLNTFLVYLYGG
jgi:cation:H+ antiporter